MPDTKAEMKDIATRISAIEKENVGLEQKLKVNNKTLLYLEDRYAKLKKSSKSYGRALSKEEGLAANRIEDKYQTAVDNLYHEFDYGRIERSEYERELKKLKQKLAKELKDLDLPANVIRVDFEARSYKLDALELEEVGDYRTAQRVRQLVNED